MTVLPVEIRHLIRLTGILLHQESTVGKEGGVSPEVMSGGYCGGVPPLPIPNREVPGLSRFSFWSFYLYGFMIGGDML